MVPTHVKQTMSPTDYRHKHTRGLTVQLNVCSSEYLYIHSACVACIYMYCKKINRSGSYIRFVLFHSSWLFATFSIIEHIEMYVRCFHPLC